MPQDVVRKEFHGSALSTVDSVSNELGERPIWDEVNQRLIWVDIDQGTIFQHTSDTGVATISTLPVSIGAVGLRRGGGFVAATGDGFRILDEDGETVAGPFRPDDMDMNLRFNDGYCDPGGRFWAGTASVDGSSSTGSLYRFDPDGHIVTAINGVIESNGIGWSPEGSTMYYIDSGQARVSIKAYEYDSDSGRLGECIHSFVPKVKRGVPDGMIVDSEGCLWIAFWGGGAVRRYMPSGVLLETYHLPVQFPTCPCLGGSDLKTLYVTTASLGDDRSSTNDLDTAGRLYSIPVGVAGQHTSYFG